MTLRRVVRLCGDHPWKGHSAEVVTRLDSGCLIVRLRDGLPGHEVYAWPEQWEEPKA